MRSIVFSILVATAVTATADVPVLRQGILSRANTDSSLEFEIFPDRAKENLLYLLPKSLKIARDDNGEPKISVVLLREALERGRDSDGHGYVMISVTVGPRMTDEVYDVLRRRIARLFPELENPVLLPIGFKPGTAQIGFQVLDSGAPATWVPVGAPHTLGAEIPLMIPITKEHGAQIRQVFERPPGSADSRDLSISISYKGEATFEIAPTTVSVEANRSEMYKYFQSKKKLGGGFWIYNWSTEREKIREEFQKRKHLTGRIRFGDADLIDKAGGAKYLTALLDEAMNRAVDFMADIKVARTPEEVTMEGYKIRPGRTTIFRPDYYWTYESYLSLGRAEVDLKRISTGEYSEEVGLEGSVALPITLAAETVPLPTSVVTVVGLDNAFHVRELLTGVTLDRAEIWGNTRGKIRDALLEVIIGENSDAETEQIVKFHFDRLNPGTRAVAFWRNARFRRVQREASTLIEPILPRMRVRGEIATAQGGKIQNPQNPHGYTEVRRSTSPFEPQTVKLSDLFGIATIDAEVFFELMDPGCKGILRARIERPGRGKEAVTLKRSQPYAFIPFVVRADGGAGFGRGTTMTVQFIGRSRTVAGEPVPIENMTEVFPTLDDLSDGWEASACGGSE